MVTKVYIEKRKGATKHQLYIYITRRLLGKGKVRSGVRIEDQYWDRKRQRVKSTHPLAAQINRVLTDMQRMAESTYWELMAETMKEPSNKELTDAIKIKLGRKVADTPEDNRIDFFTYVEKELIPRKHDVGEHRVTVYHTVLRHLKTFEKKKKYRVDFETIDMSFHHKFMGYLNELNFTKSYIYESIMKTLIFFLNQATDEGYNTNMAYKDKRFRKRLSSGKGTGIYLNKTELETLYSLDLSDNPRLERVRDTFLVGAYTGLRYCDYKNISHASLVQKNGKSLLRVLTQKTKAEVFIPLHTYVKFILEKYDYQLPTLSNQKLNQYLKELGQYALLDELVEKITIRGKSTDRVIKPKYELITTHTARRSFATNAYMSGELSAPQIMRMTGHASERNFLRYIRVGKSEAAYKAADADFFNPENVKSNN